MNIKSITIAILLSSSVLASCSCNAVEAKELQVNASVQKFKQAIKKSSTPSHANELAAIEMNIMDNPTNRLERAVVSFKKAMDKR